MKKIVIITGGSKGLGLGLAKEYHKQGYRIISISRSKIERLYSIEQYQCDLSKFENIEPILNEIFLHIDSENTENITLINNAGYLGEVNTIENIIASDINYALSVNLIAPLILTSQFIKHTKNWTSKKQIFNISSGAAVSAYESWAKYCSSKAGLDMMTKVVSKEQEDNLNGVSIVSIYPGVVDTDMQAELRNTPKKQFKKLDKFKDLHEKGQLYSPSYVAKKIYELDMSGKLTNGTILDVRNV
ncbi:SDR family NAD(P)-dependent oxidoreductase [Lutibacter sp. TH_r2]|uniref:SDR family NAD(P)-dependent oxidoreductase n=1 Tax=Lutibacter sp. TH_r2 TaxID=3082083 RepID=UPI002955CB9B|nr:SDR family NAD(P)-dependent oxidoreductase [Lutibacter sp. TH_r2]MDV7187313.1 SDR family NAD(P)-dependent oxidoreductase [Lutibacter sp. TH_r2]